MGRLRSLARRAVIRTASAARTVRNRAYFALGGPGAMEILAYRGYGTADRLHVKGRVLADKGLRPGRKEDRFRRNMRNMRKRILSRPIPHAIVEASFQGRTLRVRADDLGYFEAWIRPTDPLPAERVWHQVSLTLLEPLHRGQGPVRTVAWVRVPGPETRLVVVSDMDDTVVRTGATSILSLLRESFTGNAYTRVPFPGVAALYRALQAGQSGRERNPLLFVSRSPWNLYDLFAQFLQLHGIDEEPIVFLRRWGFTEEGMTVAKVRGHKYAMVSQMLDLYAPLPFVLVGDSGQRDPEIYREVIRTYPGRVLAVYIRNVSREPGRAQAIRELAREVAAQGSTLILAEDSLEMARHAAASGWIAPAAVEAVASERELDREAAGEEPAAEAPARRVAAADQADTAAAVQEGTLDRELAGAEEEHAPVVVEPERGREDGSGRRDVEGATPAPPGE